MSTHFVGKIDTGGTYQGFTIHEVEAALDADGNHVEVGISIKAVGYTDPEECLAAFNKMLAKLNTKAVVQASDWLAKNHIGEQ